MSDSHSLLFDLQSWFKAQCDGNWEEDFGVTINTSGNPGWAVVIDLDGTWLEDRQFQPLKVVAEESCTAGGIVQNCADRIQLKQ